MFTNFFIFGKDAFTKTAKASPWRDDDQCERAFMSYFKAAGLMLLIHLAFAGVGWSIAAQAFTPTPGNESVWERTFQQWEGMQVDPATGEIMGGVQ